MWYGCGVAYTPRSAVPEKIEQPALRYIVVEGPIGVGKSTLTRAIARERGGETLFEVFEENPFLAPFYGDRARYALATELFFLLSRYDQQKKLAQGDLFRPCVISDYLFDKCRLFAEMTLDDAELAVFERMFGILREQVPVPDLVVHLHAPVDVLMHRIEERGRSYERQIDADYLSELSRQYHAFFRDYVEAPVASIDTTTLDFRDTAQVRRLLAHLQAGARGQLAPASLLP